MNRLTYLNADHAASLPPGELGGFSREWRYWPVFDPFRERKQQTQDRPLWRFCALLEIESEYQLYHPLEPVLPEPTEPTGLQPGVTVSYLSASASGGLIPGSQLVFTSAQGGSQTEPGTLINFTADVQVESTLECVLNRQVRDEQRKEEETTGFLQEVYALSANHDLGGATDRIFGHIDSLLCLGNFPRCNAILKQIELEKLPATLMRSFLTITAAAKDKLPARKALYDRVVTEMTRLKGRVNTERLLSRLA
jgi:hypothetical protein